MVSETWLWRASFMGFFCLMDTPSALQAAKLSTRGSSPEAGRGARGGFQQRLGWPARLSRGLPPCVAQLGLWQPLYFW